MAPIPRYRTNDGPVVLSAGFRPFFLLAAFWAGLVIPASVAFFAAKAQLPTAFPPLVWHAHEMTFGYGEAVVAGFLLTAIPNWTGRMPLQGPPLAILVLLWLCGRIAIFFSASIEAGIAASFDLAFPLMFLIVITREIISGRNWRNLPMVGALGLLLLGNSLTHFDAIRNAGTAEIGNRIGVATLLMLICLIGGRIIPSFTRNWLVKQEPNSAMPAPFDVVDRIALTTTAVSLLAWVAAPEARTTSWLALVAGTALAGRLSRWRGSKTLSEPLLWALHLGYGWLSFGLLALGFNGLVPLLPSTSAMHALTVGAIGTMTLAVMTRASLGHTGRSLVAGPRTTAIYVMVTLAALIRVAAPLFGAYYFVGLSLAAAAWCGAFGGFLLFYLGPLTHPRVQPKNTASI